jgi:hypothetical protein
MVTTDEYAESSPDARCQYVPLWVRETVKDMQPRPKHPKPTKLGANVNMCLAAHIGGF